MAKIMFIKPHLETDANWDPVRTCPYLGIWYLASHLKQKGHNVRYLDEVVRNGGFAKRTLFKRNVSVEGIHETPIDFPWDIFQIQKMWAYNNWDNYHFLEKHSAFNKPGTVSRIIARTGNSQEETLEEIAKFDPEIVGIPLIATANYLPATNLGRGIKDKFPKIKVVFGGQHISALPDEFLQENPFVDHAVTGDAIQAIENIVDGKTKDKLVRGGFSEMESFPLLDPKLLEENNYPTTPTYSYPTFGRKAADFMFSKGCFRHCDFCVAGSQKTHVTITPYNRVDEQLKLFKEKGIEELIIQDDAFLWDKNHVRQHLPRVLELMKKYGFHWQNNGGIEFEGLDDFVTDQLVQYQKGEGKLTSLYIPFNPRSWNKTQSASRTMSQRYHENTNNLRRLRDAGVYVFTSAIIGTPEQTVETFWEELETDKDLIEKGYIDAALPLSATMLPGTSWYKDNKRNIVNLKDYPGYSLFTVHHRTENLQPRVIEELMLIWTKELSSVQKMYKWGTAFPNSTEQ
jgi:radical SAM superfamily enzyme YgiQ (UPF0313 family)